MDTKKGKKFIQSPVAIICYVLAALMLVYTCFQAGSTVKQINDYYANYGMNAKPTEYITYVLQAIIQPLLQAITIFMAGYILNTVRKLDPKNYKSAKELVEIEEARKEAKEKKQVAKGEAKAAKSEAKAAKAGFSASTASKEESVRADFTESLEAELKSDAKASTSGNRRNGQSRSRNSQSKGSSAKNGNKSSSAKSENKSGSKSEGSKKSPSRKPAPKKEEVQEALSEAYNKSEAAAEKTVAED